MRFSAEIQGFKSAMGEAAAATEKLKKVSEEASAGSDTNLGRLIESAHKNREAWDTAGTTMAGFGAAAVAGLGLAGEAATSIAQISNVMGTMEHDGSEGVERFAATLVALGKAGASTEAEIVDMAQCIAGAGKLVGASESDVLALANAMASVGIESQLGGCLPRHAAHVHRREDRRRRLGGPSEGRRGVACSRRGHDGQGPRACEGRGRQRHRHHVRGSGSRALRKRLFCCALLELVICCLIR